MINIIIKKYIAASPSLSLSRMQYQLLFPKVNGGTVYNSINALGLCDASRFMLFNYASKVT